MRKLSNQDFHEINLWMHRNARPLELAIWRHNFDKENTGAVLSELSYYQNTDGGFGNRLEPDCWNPESSPYTTNYAISLLKRIGFTDKNHSIMKGIFEFFENTTHCSESGWSFSIPSNNDWAHAPWWTYNPDANKLESTGLTAEICAFIFLNAAEGSELYNRALSFCSALVERLNAAEHHGDMGIGGYCVLLEAMQEARLQNRFDLAGMEARLKNLVHDSIERDTSKWALYSVRPSNYIISPDSIYYPDNKDIVELEIEYIIDTRPENGVWPITWSWFDFNDKYPKEFAISENWWKGIKGIEKMSFLKNFGRLE